MPVSFENFPVYIAEFKGRDATNASTSASEIPVIFCAKFFIPISRAKSTQASPHSFHEHVPSLQRCTTPDA
jgi:hypothetical protein